MGYLMKTPKKQTFVKKTAHGAEVTSGYIFGAFGIEPDGYRSWWITHIPTGSCFLYSEWQSLGKAQEFCERMNAVNKWDFQLNHTVMRRLFNETAERIALELGGQPRSCEVIS